MPAVWAAKASHWPSGEKLGRPGAFAAATRKGGLEPSTAAT